MLATAAFVERGNFVEEPITDLSLEAERCQRYDWSFNPHRTTRRRAFLGCNIADDSWHTIFFSAMEYRGLLSGVAFIESNRTQTLTERNLRFPPGSDNKRLMESTALWGESTSVDVDYYVDPPGTKDVLTLARENYQRNAMFPVFARQGMTRDDIAIVSDPDELFTRDFLYALKTCEIPEWTMQPHDCLSPKVTGSAINIEATPMCVMEQLRFSVPAALPGECVIGIGDESLHPPVHRVAFIDRMERANDWKDQIAEGKLGPLWDATDFRIQPNIGKDYWDGTTTGKYPNRTDLTLHTGFHLHDYFTSLAILRNKYLTYGHPVPNADVIPLQDIQPILKLLVSCLMGLENPYSLQSYTSFPLEYLPIAWQRLPEYAQQRHDEFVEGYLLDQKKIENRTGNVPDVQQQEAAAN
jgi:hypothetical protein